jgi:hypothetical protein
VRRIGREGRGWEKEERNQDTEYLIFLGDQNGVSWDSAIFAVFNTQHKALRKYRS